MWADAVPTLRAVLIVLCECVRIMSCAAHSIRELPTVAEACGGATRALAAAAALVDAGRCSDHPKLHQLSDCIVTHRALHPVSIMIAIDIYHFVLYMTNLVCLSIFVDITPSCTR